MTFFPRWALLGSANVGPVGFYFWRGGILNGEFFPKSGRKFDFYGGTKPIIQNQSWSVEIGGCIYFFCLLRVLITMVRV